MKTCRQCGKRKQLKEFHKSNRHRLGVKNECSNCTNHYLREHYKDNPRTPAQKRNQTDKHLIRKYGISLEDYNLLYKEQEGKCAICHKKQKSLNNTRISKGKKIVLVVDHCHESNKVRGLLCQECNQALGLFKDNATTLYNAAYYLEQQ